VVFVLRPPTGAGFATLLYSRPPGVLILNSQFSMLRHADISTCALRHRLVTQSGA